MNRILNIPEDEYNYEFMVIIPRDDGDYDWYSNHENPDAYETAKQVGGIVCHNVRIAHKERRK